MTQTFPEIDALDRHEEFSKKPVVLVDLLLARCAHTYSIAPCTASLATSETGQKCFNAFGRRPGGCQDEDNFLSLSEFDLLNNNLFPRFTKEDTPQLPGVTAFNQLKQVKPIPTGIDQEGGLGGHAQISFVFNAFEEPIDLLDPYRIQRPTRKGEFFAKLKVRNPHYIGRPLLYRVGFLGTDGSLDVGAMRTQRYIIESIEVTGKDEWTIVAKDVLKKLDRQKRPRVVALSLEGAILAGGTSFTLQADQGPELVTAAGTGEPSAADPIIVRIGNEFIQTESRAGDVFSVLTRGAVGEVGSGSATAAGHADNAKVQPVYFEDGTRTLAQALQRLLNEGGVPDVLIDLVGMIAEVATWLFTFNPVFYESRPTAISKLIQDHLRASNSFMWWEAETQVTRFRHNRPLQPDETKIALNDEAHLDGERPPRPKDDHDARATRSIVYYGTKDWSKNFRDSRDADEVFLEAQGFIDLTAEGVNAYNEEKPIEVFAFMIPETRRAEMRALAFRKVSRNVDAPRDIPIVLEAAEGYTIQPGVLADLTAVELLDEFGELEPTEVIVLSKARREASEIRYDLMVRTTGLDKLWAYYQPVGVPGFTTATEEQKKGAFYAKPNGKIDDANGFEVPGYVYP